MEKNVNFFNTIYKMYEVNKKLNLLQKIERSALQLPQDLVELVTNGKDCSDVIDSHALVNAAESESFYTEQIQRLQKDKWFMTFIFDAKKPAHLSHRVFFNRLCHIQGYMKINRQAINYTNFQDAYDRDLKDYDWMVTHWLYAAGKHIIPTLRDVDMIIEFVEGERKLFSAVVVGGNKESVATSISVYIQSSHFVSDQPPTNFKNVTGIVYIKGDMHKNVTGIDYIEGDVHKRMSLFIPNNYGRQMFNISYSVTDTNILTKEIIDM